MLALLNSGVIAGGGPVSLDGPLPLYAKILMPILLTLFRWANLTGGAFLFCTREAFDKAGGWDETYYAGEEIQFAQALKRRGRFKLVRTPVLTSGRKLRTHSARELFGLLLLTPSMTKDRSKLDFFYGPRRGDPFLDG